MFNKNYKRTIEILFFKVYTEKNKTIYKKACREKKLLIRDNNNTNGYHKETIR